MGKPHKHAELIKAWADGAEIEYKVGSITGRETDEWQDVLAYPSWNEKAIYRIKPEPKPDFYRFIGINAESQGQWSSYISATFLVISRWQNKLKLTFDGETGKLKSAEVLE